MDLFSTSVPLIYCNDRYRSGRKEVPWTYFLPVYRKSHKIWDKGCVILRPGHLLPRQRVHTTINPDIMGFTLVNCWKRLRWPWKMKWNLGSLVFSSMNPCSQPKKIYLSHLSHFLGLFVVQREVCDANIVASGRVCDTIARWRYWWKPFWVNII